MPDESFNYYNTKSREVHEAEVSALQEKNADLEKKLTEALSRLEAAKFRLITLDTLVRQPVISTRADNCIRFVNSVYVQLSGYVEEDVVGKPITDFVQGLDFLVQFPDHPELVIVEKEPLSTVPIALKLKNGVEQMMSANVGFRPGESAGYHGVTLVCEPREVPSRLQRVGRYLLSAGGWFSRVEVIEAVGYAEQGKLILTEQDLVNQGEPSIPQRFLQDVTKAVIQKKGRGVVVKFADVASCSPRIYEGMKSIAIVAEHPFTCIVEEDSVIYQELKKIGFPEKNMLIKKKK